MKIRNNVKAGGMLNRSQVGLRVKTTVKAGGIRLNHNQSGFPLRDQ